MRALVLGITVIVLGVASLFGGVAYRVWYFNGPIRSVLDDQYGFQWRFRLAVTISAIGFAAWVGSATAVSVEASL